MEAARKHPSPGRLPAGRHYLGRYVASLHRRGQSWLARELAPLGLGAATWPPLLALYSRDGQRQEELASHAGVDKAAMKRAVDSLEEAGYVHREADPGDGRVWRVVLTRKAHKARSEIEAILSRWEAVITEGLEPGEVELARSLLAAMSAKAEGGSEGGPDVER